MTKRGLALILSVLMILSVISSSVFAADKSISDGWYSVSLETADKSSSFGFGEKSEIEGSQYSAEDTVRVSIVLNDAPTIEKYSPDNISQNKSAIKYRSKLKSNQDKITNKISETVLDGEDLEVVWNLTLTVNIISANVKYGSIEDIKNLPEVKDVVIESCHAADTDEYVEGTAAPEMAISGGMTNTYSVWAEGYTGAGTTIAVIDTGIDIKHISFDAGAFEYALGTLNEEVDLVTKDDIAAVFDQLNIKKRVPSLTVDDVYCNSKVPFAYNYVDENNDVSHINDTAGEHGSHVAGIAAANRYVPDGNGGYAEALSAVHTQGQAPDAQLFVMKVFGQNGGAYDSDEYAAIEDSIILGLDCANLSLGTNYPGFTLHPEFQRIIDSVANSNTMIIVSAGNSFYWAHSTYGGLPYAEDKTMATGGYPGVNVTPLSVASVENTGIISPYIGFAGKELSYTETNRYGADPMQSLAGEHEFIAIDGYGAEEDFEALSGVLAGKIFICSRGQKSFYIKANNAVENGAIATVIYNNVAGGIGMDLTGYSYSAPVIALSQDDGNFIKENAQKVTDGEGNVLYYTGKITVSKDVKANLLDPDYYTMSDFSSWGVPASLILKPEITAPGGDIYSVYGEAKNENGFVEGVGNDQYELMSGTSMAAPQVAGISALVAEYIRKYDLEKKTGLTKRQLTNSLLMGTSRPLLEESTDYYYSVLKQGSGLVDTKAVFKTHTFITMNEDATASYADGKVKAELGEVSRDTKSFSFSFKVNNFGGTASDYILSSDFFTQDYIEGPDFDYEGHAITDGEGSEKTRLYMALTTTDLKTDVKWTVNGEAVVTEDSEEYDFNSDGAFSYADVQIILEYVVGNVKAFDKMENADIDGDGDIDTYDAYLVADILKNAKITVPAGESADVCISVDLLDIDDYDINGAYIEGYVFIAEADSEDGIVSSIPVLGYYGNWYDFDMFDHGSYIDDYYDNCYTTPYLAYQLGKAAYKTNYFAVNHKDSGKSYIYFGNSIVPDSEYLPQRNAISPENTLDHVRFTLIRNAADTEVVITDSEGNEIFKKSYGRTEAAYYFVDNETWDLTGRFLNINFDPSTLNEGDVFTVTLRTAPEYYAMKGEIDWDSFSDSTRLSQQFTVDGTAPEILSAEFHYDEATQKYDAAKITVKDNQYTSAIVLTDENRRIVYMIGSDSDPDAAPGLTREILIDLDDLYTDFSEFPDHMILYADDYAGNETYSYINLNKEELAAGRKIKLDRYNADLAIGSYGTINADVMPWGSDCGIIWSSDNENIAAVDENGRIKGVGIGNTVITATAEDDPNAYAKVNVSVSDFNRSYSGVLWDENADKWFISFNTENLYDYTTDYNEPLSYPLASLCYGVDGTLYGATYDENKEESALYIINKDTYEETLVGSPGAVYTDIAAAPAVSDFFEHQFLIGTSSTCLVWIDTDTGIAYTPMDLSEYTEGSKLVGVAFEASTIDEDSETCIDKYYLIDQSGYLYHIEITIFLDDQYRVNVDISDLDYLGYIGDGVNVPYFQSLYLDTDGYLVWSRTTTWDDDSYLYIYVYDITDTDNIKKYDFGTLDFYVWPIGGIYEKDRSPAFAYSSLVTLDSADGNTEKFKNGKQFFEEAKKETKAERSGFFVYAVSPEDDVILSTTVKVEADRGIEAGTVSFEITAKEIMKNGLYTVSFDPETYELKDIYSDADFFAYNLTDGVLTAAFVEYDGYAADDVVATVELNAISDGIKTVKITNEESNADRPGTVKYLFLPGDINGDGSVDNKDVVVLFRYVSGFEIEVNEAELDVNRDGSVNNKDITVLFRQLNAGT